MVAVSQCPLHLCIDGKLINLQGLLYQEVNRTILRCLTLLEMRWKMG